MDKETKNRLRKRFDQMLDSADTPLETLSDLESLALRLREQIAQATLDEAGQELEERQAPADPRDPDTQSLEESCKDSSQASNRSPKIICPHYLGSAWSKGDRVHILVNRCRSFVTLAGMVCLTRRYFYCRRCDQGFCPLDSRLGLPWKGGFTLRLTNESPAIHITGDRLLVGLSSLRAQGGLHAQAVQTLSRLTQVEVSP